MPSYLAELKQDPVLQALAVGYSNPTFIGTRILPLVPSRTQTFKYPIYGEEAFAQAADDATESGGGSTADLEYDTGTATCKGHMVDAFVPAHSPLDQSEWDERADKTTLIAQKMLLRKEVEILTAVLAGVGSTQASGGNWDDSVSTDILGEVDTEMDTFEGLIGVKPNFMVIPVAAWRAVKANTAIRAALGISGNSQVGQVGRVLTPLVAELFEVDEIIVPRARYKADPDDDAGTKTNVWDSVAGAADTVLFGYRAPLSVDANGRVNGERVPSCGRTVYWSQTSSEDGITVTTHELPPGTQAYGGRGTGGGTVIVGTDWRIPVVTCANALRTLTGVNV